jgi:hypothetical protein
MLHVSLRVDAACSLIVTKRVASYVQGFKIRRRASAQTTECALKGVLKSLSEVPVEIRVDEWIQC